MFDDYVKIIRMLHHECEVLIEKSVPKVIVWQHEALPSDAKLYPRDRFIGLYSTPIIFFFLHTYVCPHLNKIYFTLKYSTFMSAILILTSFL